MGGRVAKTFSSVGIPAIGVRAIIHSWITNLLGKNPSEANVRRFAKRFKHNPTTTLRYFQGGPPPETLD